MSWLPYLTDFWFILVALAFLGLSIFVHELGHFLAAKRRGLVIKRFSIGFGPRIFGWEKNGVEYRLSAIPFGGYVALPQLVDMGRIEGSEDGDQDKGGDDENDEETDEEEPEELPPISYVDKMIVSVMGAVFNVIFAFCLACVPWLFGQEVYDWERTTEVGHVQEELEFDVQSTDESVTIDGPAYKDGQGVKPGDKILTVDGEEVRNFQDIRNRIAAGTGRKNGSPVVHLEVEREGTKQSIEIQPGIVSNEEMRMIGIGPKQTFFVGKLMEGKPKYVEQPVDNGLEPGDQLWKVNGEPIHSFFDLKDNHLKKSGYGPVELTVRKGGEGGPLATYTIHTEERLTIWTEEPIENGKWKKDQQFLIGFAPEFKKIIIHPNPVETIWNRANDMYVTLRALVSTKSNVKLRNMSGPVSIVHHLSWFARIGFMKLLWFVVFINVNLAILNLLPIPVLDGGHMMFATIDKLRGKPIPLPILERIQVVFIALLLSFMLYVTWYDLMRIIFGA